jgi:hypothetical protein
MGNGGRPAVKGICFTCDERGHRRQDCRVKRPPRLNTVDATPFGRYVAFPAIMSTSISDSDAFWRPLSTCLPTCTMWSLGCGSLTVPLAII